jgi:peroxisomal membrane protein 4
MSRVQKYAFPEYNLRELGWVKASLRALRNAIVTGARIRLPYIIQAATFTAFYRDKRSLRWLQFTIKQALTHGRDLGLFVLIYKSVCSVLRAYGINNGAESWIGGFIGGYYGLGDSSGTRGTVNYQIVLYLLSRGLVSMSKGLAERKAIPRSFDLSRGVGFRCLAGFSLALILYLTEHEPEQLKPSFMRTMTYIYHDADRGHWAPPRNYALPVLVVFATLFIGTFYKPLAHERVLELLDFNFFK